MLGPLPLDVQRQPDDLDVEETGSTYLENAELKASAAALRTQGWALADDSGLEVDFLNGGPGIYSARYSGEGDEGNNAKLLRELNGVEPAQRTARYQCVLVYMRHPKDSVPIICQGAWEGRILEAPRGDGGFGYDPLFYVPTHDCSAAELDKSVKNRISHRAIASAKLLDALKG